MQIEASIKFYSGLEMLNFPHEASKRLEGEDLH